VAKGQHPTQKPLGLLKKIITQFTDKDDLILDPYMGSGTTLRAAMDLGRRAIGIEIDGGYCELAARRLAQRSLFSVDGFEEA
jgi:site-specific DNA-methyltransferase (adenine-specific)